MACHEEFDKQNGIMITLFLYVNKRKNKQQNHIQYDNQEMYCYSCDKYISHNCQIWKNMKKHVLNVKSASRTLTL